MTELANTVPFKYAGFWDVPRYIVFEWLGHKLLLESLFDDDLDDYEPQYSVYVLTKDFEIEKPNWHESNRCLLGKVEVKSIIFDETKRARLDPTPLIDLFGPAHHG